MTSGHRACGLTVLALLFILGAGLAGPRPRQTRPGRTAKPAPAPPAQPVNHTPLPVELTPAPVTPAGWAEARQDDPKQPGKMPGDEAPRPVAPPADVTASINQRIVIRPDTFDAELDPDEVVVDRPELFIQRPEKDKPTRPFRLSADKKSVELEGVRLGRARVRIYDPAKKGPPYTATVQIVPDIFYLNGLVKSRFPMANLTVTAAGDDFLFVDGYVENPAEVEAVEDLLKKFFAGGVVNNIRVAGGMQVQLEVVIARVDRTQLRQLGVNLLANDQYSFIGSQLGSLINTPQVTLPTAGANVFRPIGPNQPALTSSATAFFGVTTEAGAIYGFIEALQQRNVAKILANPTLVTFSGRQADFLVGGEQPIPVAGTITAPVVSFKPFGTRLTFLPTVLGGGRIRLDVAPEVSTTNFANSITVSGLQVPQFIVQRLHATVELQTGQTLCLGGLLQSELEAQTQRVPFFGSLPVVGTLFRRTRHRVAETELLVLVTPRIFNPLDGCQVPQVFPGQSTVSPTDAQLFGHAVLEAAPGSAKHPHHPQLGDGIAGSAAPTRPAPGAGSYQNLRELVTPGAAHPADPPAPPNPVR